MTPKRISALLVIALAVIAATVATGLIAGYVMQAWIVSYWMVLTIKNVVDYIAVHEGRRENKETKETDAEMASTKLSAPWVKLYKEIQALFKEDDGVKVIFDETEKEIKLYVEDYKKAVALAALLEGDRIYGNVIVTITVYPADGWANDEDEPMFDSGDTIALYEAAFDGNEALSYIKASELPFWDGIIYVVFKNKVVQYFNDDIGDVNGNCSTLYQEIAKDVFMYSARDGVYFCTDLPENPGNPVDEWP